MSGGLNTAAIANSLRTRCRLRTIFLNLNQYLRRVTAQNGDGFDSFIHGPVVEFNEGANVYSWLKDNYSSLIRRQALDLLSIPVMLAEVERVFSSAKLLITPQRNSLSDERIKYLELLRY